MEAEYFNFSPSILKYQFAFDRDYNIDPLCVETMSIISIIQRFPIFMKSAAP